MFVTSNRAVFVRFSAAGLATLSLVAASACAGNTVDSARTGPPDPLSAAKAMMRSGRYADAVEELEARLAEGPSHPDEGLYLQALGQFYTKDFETSLQTLDKLLADHESSPWYRKARFLQARDLVSLRRFQAAESIYSAEANRLLSETRKHEIAGVIVSFADALAKKPDPNDLAASPPNFQKAHELYAQALDMEIGRSLRDEVMFKRALAIFHAGDFPRAIEDFRAYLQQYDPDWMGQVGTAQRMSGQRRDQPIAAGQHLFQARYYLSRSQLSAGQPLLSRTNAEDLLALIAGQRDDAATDGGADQHSLAAQSAWLIVETFNLSGIPAEELERGVNAARQFLKQHPSHPRCVQAAWQIAEAYHRHGRADQAAAEFQQFFEGEGFQLPVGEAAHQPLEGLGQSPAELMERLKQTALYNLGQIRFSQKRYDQAAEAWGKYASRFPNGPQWSQCQLGIVNAEFSAAIDVVLEKDYSRASDLLNAFLTKHPLDDRAPMTLFLFGRMDLAEADALAAQDASEEDVKSAYQRAVERWQRFVSKYPQSPLAFQAHFEIGTIYEEKLQDLEQGLRAYRQVTSGPVLEQARQRIALMVEKRLMVTTERKYDTSETASITIDTRNIEQLTVRQYYLDLEAYFRKTHDVGRVDGLDIDLIQPDKTWEIQVSDYAKYVPTQETVEVPFDGDGAGVCLVSVSDGELQATTLVIRSDLDLIVKSSRRELLVFAQNRLQDAPAGNVQLLISDGKQVFATGLTDEDGVFRSQLDELKDASSARVFAVKDSSVAAHQLDLSQLNLSTGLTPKGYLYTDRPAYQPGQLVRFRGMIRDVDQGSYVVPVGQSYQVSIHDPNGRLLWERAMELSEFGTFHGEFPLGENVPPGSYQLVANQPDGATYASTFQVQDFKLEKIELTIETDRDVYFRGEQVEVTVAAHYYWGQPLANQTIHYILPDNRTLIGTTDDAGQFTTRFDTTGMRAGQPLRFLAMVDGENVSTQTFAALANQGYRISVTPSQPLILSGEPVDVEIQTTSPDGKPLGREITLRVLRRSPTPHDPILDGLPLARSAATAAAEVTVLEMKVTTDDESGKAVVNLQDAAIEPGGRYILRAAGTDRFEQVVSGEAAMNVSDDDGSTKFRFFNEGDTLQVGRTASLRLHSRVKSRWALLTYEGETIIGYDVVSLEEGYNPVPLDVGHEHFPNFRVAVSLIDGQQLRTAAKDFKVQRQLNISVRPLADQFEPGAMGKVELEVTDQLGRPVRGELSLALVEEALFARFDETTPAIVDFFQGDARRHAEFRAASTCGFRYTAESQTIPAEYIEELARMGRALNESLELKDQMLRREVEVRLPASVAAQLAEPRGAIQSPQEDMAASPFGDVSDESRDGADANNVFFEQGSFGGGGAQAAESIRLLIPPPSRGSLSADSSSRTSGAVSGALFGFDANSSPVVASPRVEIPDQGWWAGSIVTDETGKATVEIPLPQSTTRWRVTARGVSVDTLVGQATANVMTRKDFFVSVKAPQFAREGDSLRVLAKAHNLTDRDESVLLTLTVWGGDDLNSKLAQRTAQVELKSQGVAEALFESFDVPAESRVKLQVTATGGNLSDALVVTLPVRPWGLEFADQAGGTADNSTSTVVELPDDRKYQTQWMTISVGPNLKQSVIDMALAGVEPYALSTHDPSRCILPPPPSWGRHAGSDLLAVVSALQYARDVDAPTLEVHRLQRRVRSLVSDLVVSQREDGGWAWQSQQQEADWAATAMSFWALSDARKLGVSVHGATLDQAQAYLVNQFTQLGQSDNDGKSAILHALSCRKGADFAHVNRLYRGRNQLSPPALAYTALTLAKLDRDELAGEVLDVLESKVARTSGRASWDGSKAHPWLNDEVESTAVAALALMKARPTSTTIADAVAFLLDRQGVWGFVPAKAHGPALSALCHYFGRNQPESHDFTINIRVNGELFETVSSHNVRSTSLFSVPANLIVNGKNRVDFDVQGKGQFAFAVSMRGFSSNLADPGSWDRPRVHRHYYRHATLDYRGRPIQASSTSPVSRIETGQTVQVYVDLHPVNHQFYAVVEESLPAGMMLVDGTLTANCDHHVVRGDRIVMYYRPGQRIQDYTYELNGYASGSFRVLPTVIRDAMQPGQMRIHEPRNLTVLGPGEASDDPYRMNDAERFALGKLNFDDGRYQKALEYLKDLFERPKRYQEADVARMLLWIYTAEEFYDAQQIVDVFEVLRERYPALEIPFDKILTVGKAYRDIGEFERGYQVYRATIDASFVNDSHVSAILDDEGQFLGAIDYQEDLWREYPDSAEVVSAYFALSQSLYQTAPHAHELAAQHEQLALAHDDAKPTRVPDTVSMLRETLRLLSSFLTLYSENPLADDAGFSMANALLDLKQYDLVVEACRRFQSQFSESDLQSSFQYMVALGQFWLREHQQALAAARIVAEGESQDRDLARYIIGQIHHAENNPKDAIEWYAQVATLYSDAQEAIDYFESKHIELDEVHVFRPGEAVELTIDYRNIAEARCQVYPVDLMRLYLREKNLANVTNVNLAGIQPLVEKTVHLGEGKDYVDKQHTMTFDLPDEGAYLVICRGDNLFTSALTLVTPLVIEMQEDIQSGRVRANVINAVTKDYIPEVHVKAIGSADTEFRSGETDLRGVFVAGGLHGMSTIIARDGDARYAFYRGESWLGAPADGEVEEKAEADSEQSGLDVNAQGGKDFDYQQNLRSTNSSIQQFNYQQYDQLRRGRKRGVEVQQAQ